MRYFIIIAIASVLIGCVNAGSKRVCIGSTCVVAEVADTQRAQAKGLMFRTTLPQTRGMLFIFELPGYYSFWMKNMRFPIDILWVAEDKTIVDISENVLPCTTTCKSITSSAPVRFVLEVNAGFASEHTIRRGDRVSF